jgi:hypothetical protein
MPKTSTIIGLTIATILTAYLSALVLANDAFAQPVNPLYPPSEQVIWAKTFESEEAQVAAHEAQAGKVLAGHLDERPHCQESEGTQCLEPIPTVR